MNVLAPPDGHRTACCSKDYISLSLVSETVQAAVGPHCRCPRAGALVTRRIVTRAAPADTLLAWGLFVCKTETLSCP